jgi:hypothetical protein
LDESEADAARSVPRAVEEFSAADRVNGEGSLTLNDCDRKDLAA